MQKVSETRSQAFVNNASAMISVRLCWCPSAEGLVLGGPDFSLRVLGNLTFAVFLPLVNRQLPTTDPAVWAEKKHPLFHFGDLRAIYSACHVVLGFFLDHPGFSSCPDLHWWVAAWGREKRLAGKGSLHGRAEGSLLEFSAAAHVLLLLVAGLG